MRLAEPECTPSERRGETFSRFRVGYNGWGLGPGRDESASTGGGPRDQTRRGEVVSVVLTGRGNSPERRDPASHAFLMIKASHRVAQRNAPGALASPRRRRAVAPRPSASAAASSDPPPALVPADGSGASSVALSTEGPLRIGTSPSPGPGPALSLPAGPGLRPDHALVSLRPGPRVAVESSGPGTWLAGTEIRAGVSYLVAPGAELGFGPASGGARDAGEEGDGAPAAPARAGRRPPPGDPRPRLLPRTPRRIGTCSATSTRGGSRRGGAGRAGPRR